MPHVRARGRGGSLVLVSSNVATHKACGYLSHYVAAKIGVKSLAMALAKELGPDGIRCNSVRGTHYSARIFCGAAGFAR